MIFNFQWVAKKIFLAMSIPPTIVFAQAYSSPTALVASTPAAVSNDCSNILNYGGDNSGSTDNSGAFASAAAAGPSGQACVYFPPGTYAFSSQLVYSLPSSSAAITIKGAGAGVSVLNWAAGGGLKIDYSGPSDSAHIRDISLVTSTTATGSAIYLDQTTSSVSDPANSALSDITNVAIHGADGYAQTNYWANGIYVSSVSNVNISNSSITGAGGGYATVGEGINLIGTSTAQGVQYNIVNSVVQYVGTGVSYNNYVQGVAISQSNFTGDNYGVVVHTPAQGQSQLTITGSQFNCATVEILDDIGIAGLLIYGNYVLVPYETGKTVVGIDLLHLFGASISSNVIQRLGSSNTNTNGLVVQGSGTPGAVVTGNVFANLFTGIWLQSSSADVNVQSNSYYGNTNSNVLNSASSACPLTSTANCVGGSSQ